MKRTSLAAALAAFAISTSPVSTPFAATQRGGVELGMLDCAIGGGTGFIIGSKKPVSCTFTPTNRKFAPETYTGSVSKWGVDIGHTKGGVMRWLVLGPSFNIYKPKALAGGYVGASAEATAGVGAGANVLVGGSGNTFHLQPVSVQGQTGLNVALGVTNFQLRAAR
jgi:uncharacterized protein DUF992